VKQTLVKLSAVVAVLLEKIVSEASRSLQEQFKSAGAVSIYPAPSSSQFNVHSIPQMNNKTTTLHPAGSAYSYTPTVFVCSRIFDDSIFSLL
jgi:hypothetical protein